ncbi:MAG: TonB-dependent receptor [Candidatus Wallbacteria bacterium]
MNNHSFFKSSGRLASVLLLSGLLSFTSNTSAAEVKDTAETVSVKLSKIQDVSDTTSIHLGEITVTANADKPGKINETPDSKQFVMKENKNDVQSDMTSFLNKNLSSVTTQYGTKSSTRISLRGIDMDKYNVLLDGVPVYVPYEGGAIDPVRISLGSIKKIEIFHGASSVLSGPNALGGTINLITNKPSKSFNNFDIQYKPGIGKETMFSSFGKNGNTFYGGTYQFADYGNYKLSGDFKTNAVQPDDRRGASDREKNNIFLIYGQTSSRGQTAFRVSRFAENFGAPVDIFTNQRYWRFPTWRKDQYSIEKTRIFGNRTLHFNLYSDRYYNVLDAFDNANYTTQNKKSSFRSIYDDYSNGLNIKYNIALDNNRDLGFLLFYKSDVHREQGNFNQPFAYSRADILDLAAEYKMKLSNGIEHTIGVAHSSNRPRTAPNNNALPDTKNATDYVLNSKKFLNDKEYIYANLGNKTRFPSLKDLYSGKLGSAIPNPSLKAENADLLSLGFHSEKPKNFNYDISIYYNKIKDGINNVYVGKLTQLQNIGKIISQGFEINVGGKIKKTSYNLGFTYNDSKDKSNAQEKPIEYRPKNKYVLNISHDFQDYLTADLFFNHTSQSDCINAGNNNTWIKLDSYSTIDFNITYKNKDTRYVFKVENLTDHNYMTSYGYPMRGRTYTIGYNISF